jgi:class 3 adenylate cyclase/tetratricopeptide (TPR) repeat protein
MVNVTVQDNGLWRYVPRISAEWQLHTDAPWQELDATLCYIDISGFTALSEKLARRGRIGAEELTDVLNHVFGGMLEVAYDRGGSLLKFGGDALLLMFRGPDHPVQACSAAVEMQGVLRQAREYEISAGRLHLKMSVGLHSGTVHLFRVGDSHKELVLTGPAASMTTEMEETAVAGEVLISTATMEALPARSAVKRKGAGWLLSWRQARAAGPGWTPRASIDAGSIADAMPVALREYLSHGSAEPEHHIATVGFVKFEGVDHLMATGGPGATASALDELFSIVQEVADEEGVTFLASDIDADGGKIIIVAGVPGVQVDDEGRVLRAARRIADRAGTLTVRIGVNQGHVFVGEIGTDFRATYTIMGDTVNLAARLMAAASPGEVYATSAALDRSLTIFESAPLEPFYVKGKQHPVQAYVVGAEVGSRPTERRGDMPFVGREKELADMQSLLASLRNGSGDAVAVVGERGVGKSRLVHEIVARLDGIDHLEIRAEPYGIDTPYRPLREPMRELLGVARGAPSSMARRLRNAVEQLAPDYLPMLPLVADVTMIEVPSTPEVDLIDPRFRQDRTADVVIELIAAVYDGPLLIEVDDGHYVDDASAHVLQRIVRDTTDRPWLVVTTRRADAAGFDPGLRVTELAPLADNEARSLVLKATEGAPLRPDDVEVIIERAGGLPLFLEEIVSAVRQSGGVDDLPDSLEAVVSAQIDVLPPLSRRMLRYASVLGRSFRLEISDRLLDAEGTRLDGATRRELAGFLEPAEQGRLRFRHAIIRDVAYEGLSFRRRSELHLRAGLAVEESASENPEEQADVLALHFARGQDHRRAWRYSLIAADHARDTYSNVEAAAHYRLALDSVRRLDDVDELSRAEVWASLGDVCERAGVFADALDAYRRATQLSGSDRYRRLDLLMKRALVRRMNNAYSAALRETAEALKLVELDLTPSGTRARAKATAERAAIRRMQQRPTETLELAERAESDARAVDDLETLAFALDLIDWAHRMLGMNDEPPHHDEALAIFERLGDMSGVALVSNNVGGLAYFDGRWDDAVAAYSRSRQAELSNGNHVQAAIPAVNTAELLINQGRLDEAEPMLIDAIRVLTASGHAAVGFAESELARLLIHRGDHAEAEALLARIREWGEAMSEPVSVLNGAILLADSKLRQGAVEEGLQLLDATEADAREMAEVFGPVLARLRGGGLAALGRFDEALARVEQGLVNARQQGLLYDEALLLDVRSEIVTAAGGDPDPNDIDEANRLFGELGVHREPVLATSIG